jgi:hypothetical protein
MQSTPPLSITYTTITESGASDTLTISSATAPSDIVLTAASTGSKRYAIDQNNGLELDFSGVTAATATTTFVWSNAGDPVEIMHGTTSLAILDATNTQYQFTVSCGGSTAELDLLVNDTPAGDPKIKIIPPTCP